VAVLEGLAMQVFLETQRLVLRRFSVADADNLVSLDADPDVMRFVPGGTSTSREEIEDEYLPAFLGYYRRYEGYGFWAVIEKASRATPGKRASGCAGRWCPGHGRLSGTRPSMTVAPRSMRLMLQVPGMRPSAWARKPGSAGCGHFRYGSAAVVLHSYMGLSEWQASEVMCISIGAVRSHLARGMSSLRRLPGPE
jgi:Acetyltransferase (GNAT) domain